MVVERPVLAIGGLAQAVLEVKLSRAEMVHGVSVEAVDVSTVALCGVHRLVRRENQALRVAPVGWVDGDAHACPDQDLLLLDDNGLVEAGDHSSRHARRIFGGIEFVEQKEKLVSAQPRKGDCGIGSISARHDIGQARELVEAPRDLTEHVVARTVAERLVHLLKAIDVDEEYGHVPIARRLVVEHGLEALAKELAVRKPGKSVEVLESPHLEMGLTPPNRVPQRLSQMFQNSDRALVHVRHRWREKLEHGDDLGIDGHRNG